MDIWQKITIEERNKHDNSFMQLNPINGFLTGEKAREFFIKSNLPTSILGQIWGVADLNKDGKLDKKEFSIACCIIKKVLTNGQSILPSTLPSNLLIDPSKPSPVIQSPPPSLIPGVQSPPAQTNTPLFNATFPTMQPTSNIMSPVTPSQNNNNLFPGLSMNSLNKNTPLTNQSNFNPRMQPVSAPSNSSNLVSTMSNGMSMSMSSLAPAVPTAFTQANNLSQRHHGYNLNIYNQNKSFRLPNPLAPIPSTTRMKFSQMFQGNDPNSTGFIAGQTAKTLLMQTGLAQGTLAQVWTLADYDKDGKLNLEEFIIAMHLCEFSKAGNTLPATLPIELQPQRAKTATLPMTNNRIDLFTSPPQAPMQPAQAQAESAEKKIIQHTFEDKRRENFDRGNAVLEAKRQMLREAEEREKREREEKERLEMEKKQRIKEEQDRRRQEEIQRQIERQRVIDAQREEERRKIFEQREAARNELLKQQRAEWERQKKQELEVQKLKLQEQLNTLKAKDKNLEFDMQTLNEKISSYKNKISDTQMNLNELNQRLETTKQSYQMKQTEMEYKQRELTEYQQHIMKIQQEKNFLNEKQNGLNNNPTPFGDNDMNERTKELQYKQQTVKQLRDEMEKMEQQISATRTQLHSAKTNLETSKNTETNYYKENDRLTQLIDQRRPTNAIRHDNSFSQSMELANAAAAFKPSLSNNNIRSATPKENYDAFKDEIFKIQQTAAVNPPPTNLINGNSHPASPAQTTTNDPFTSSSDPFSNATKSPQSSQQANFSSDWSNAFNKTTESNGFGNTDPFAADPFGNKYTNQTDAWPPQTQVQGNSFQSSFMNPQLAMVSYNPVKFRAEYTFEASREDELTIMIGDIINVDLQVKADDGWLYGECQGRVGVFPAAFTMKLSDWEAMQQAGQANFPPQVFSQSNNSIANTPISPTGSRIPNSGSFRSNKSFPVSQSFPNQSALNSNLNNTQVSNIKNYFFSIYPYQSTEIGDLVFREFEIINVVDTNEDWLTGQIVGTGTAPNNPLRAGIFPSNFVIKFNFPIEYIGKFTIGMATEPYQAQNSGELTLNPAESQLIAIKKLSPDGKWSYGESYDMSNQLKKGWFPVQSAMPLIDSSVPPIIVPSGNTPTSPSEGMNTNNKPGNSKSMSFSNKSPSISSISSTPPPPTSKVASPTASITTPEPVLNNQKNSITSETSTTSNINAQASLINPNKSNKASLDASTPPAKLANTLIGSASSTSSAGNLNNNNLNNKHVSSTPKANSKKSLVKEQSAPLDTGAMSPASATPTETQSVVKTPEVVEQVVEAKIEPSGAAPLPTTIIDQVIALYDFSSTTPETISFPKDATINIIEKSGDWWLGEYGGKMGLLPYNYVQSIKTNESS